MLWALIPFILHPSSFILLIQGFLSLRAGVRYLAYIERELAVVRAPFVPLVTVIAPCRGREAGLRENLGALFEQDYPDYEVVFVVDRVDDGAVAIIEDLMSEREGVAGRLVVAGEALDCGQKVHNLRRAVPEARTESEVFVFVDSDARPHRLWLRDLVAPLGDEHVGATTGYRWFAAARTSLPSMLRSVWNASIASALGPQTQRNFCWGGSTALRRAIFERLDMLEEWRGTVSDDFALTRALQRAKLPICFVPQCLIVSQGAIGWRELFEFTTRQIKITRVYAPPLWHIVLWTNLIFTIGFGGGVALVGAQAAAGNWPNVWMVLVLVAIFVLGVAKAVYRLRAVNLSLARRGQDLPSPRAAYLFLWPFTSVIYLINALAALFSRRIGWRGITYELKSPRETVIIRRNLG